MPLKKKAWTLLVLPSFIAFASDQVPPVYPSDQEKFTQSSVKDGAPAQAPAYTRKEVIYARPFGTALTMDVFTPNKPVNGAAVIVAISEGWYSDHAKIAKNIPLYVEPCLARGYTVFAVVHGSNPKYTLPENVEDLHRAVRFIRHNAHTYGVDPDRIGSTGDSAGGHLSLMLGGAGRPGDAKAAEPVDRASSHVQAVVAFFPPTDFLNWGEPGKRMLGQHPSVPLEGAFDFHYPDSLTNSFRRVTDSREREAIGRQVSPISHVSRDDAPTLLVVGDADSLIPPQQSRIMAAKLAEAGVPSGLIVMKGGGHDEITVREHIPQALAWFDKYLAKKKDSPADK
jgi:acetyl esterase/lipase